MNFRRFAPLIAWAAVAVPPALPDAARGQHPPGPGPDPDHRHFFYTTSQPKTIPINDARLRVDRIRYTPVGDDVVIEGDIVLGTVDEVGQAVVARLSARAAMVNPDDPALQLTEPQREAIRKLAALHRPDTPPAVAAKKLEVGQLLAGATELGSGREGSRFRPLQGVLDPIRDQVREANRGVGFLGPDDDDVPAMLGAANVFREWRWPGGVIPYDANVPGPIRGTVATAIDHWHARTDRIRFVPRDGLDPERFPNWVRFTVAAGCSSRVGKKPERGMQEITLAAVCGVPQAIHELGHCVGLWHEQGRNDRDRFVRVLAENIDPGMQFNFDLIGSQGCDVGPFDFRSIMLYPPLAFSVTRKPSLIKVGDPGADFGIRTPGLGGSTTDLSAGDLDAVQSMYPTPARPAP